MFIAVNKVNVPADKQPMVIKGFEHAAPAMKQFKGFLGLELWTADDNSLLAISRWETKEDLDEYTKNDLFKQRHGGASREDSQPGSVTYYNGQVLS